TPPTRSTHATTPALRYLRIARRFRASTSSTIVNPVIDTSERLWGGRHMLLTGYFAKNFGLGTESLNLAVREQHHQIEACKGARPVGYDHHDAASIPNGPNRCGQSCLAFSIEVGIRLVQYNEKRITEEGPCKRDPLALTGRKP